MKQVAALTQDDLRTGPRSAASVPATAARPAPVPADSRHHKPSDAHLDMILRAARDPSIDVDKMERLIALHRQMMLDEAKRQFIQAKITIRPLLPKVEKRGLIEIADKSTKAVIQSTPFARFEDIHDAVFPVLIAHGFDLDYRTDEKDGRVKVTAVLSHVAGHSEETSLFGPLDTSGSKNNIQGVGSTLSYLKRYTMCALLNIRTADKGEFDDDGNVAGDLDPNKPSTISAEQVAELRKEITARAVDEVKLCAFMQIDRLEDMPVAMFEPALNNVRRKPKKEAARG